MTGFHTWEELGLFLNPKEFAETAVLQLQNGTERTVTVLYDEPYLDVELGEYCGDRTEPRLNGKMSDLGDVRRGDTVLILRTGEVFDVLGGAQPDGTGWAVVPLASVNKDAGF
ncbi:hypothetical protein HEQ60_02310 [Haematospirillum sp. H1815]|uniref:head-tail joining protein n=1 Tax=Haematospirillum sp. H1815 TaxID=2723108 RepID=UPI00143CA03F|nr:hypothetical protein [Haematospirillum sp. H1815]NKD76605.1 hypothetical protein [Haematospirillum sp. H1815]